jgi:hypothetical protein
MGCLEPRSSRRRPTRVKTRQAVLLLAAVGALSACGHSSPVSQGPAVDPAGQVTLSVHSTALPGRHGQMYDEGAVPEIRLTAFDGSAIRPAHDHRVIADFTDLAPGRYRLDAVLRPCDANCGHLDPATSPCTARVVVHADEQLSVRWRVGSACRVG